MGIAAIEPEQPWIFGKESDFTMDQQSASRLRFEPFFVPRAPLLRDRARTAQMQALGTRIFDRRPGQGLAFLVATGCTRDYPIELSSFLRDTGVHPGQVGNFLGEEFSLAQTLRLEFVNSVKLANTGVVSALSKVFKLMHIPPDMQKIDRLVEAVAHIWWRQHERLQESDVPFSHNMNGTTEEEVKGLSLKQSLRDSQELHHLMLSTLLLHWNAHAPLQAPMQRLSLERWLEINRPSARYHSSGSSVGQADDDGGYASTEGFDESVFGGASLEGTEPRGATAEHVQRQIYKTVVQAPLPQLLIWASQPLRAPARDPIAERERSQRKPSTSEDGERLEGWVRLESGGFPSPAGLAGTTATYARIRGILSEASAMAGHSNSRSRDPASNCPSRTNSRVQSARAQAPGPPPPLGTPPLGPPPVPEPFIVKKPFSSAPGGRGGDVGVDRVWLSMRQMLLFFAPKPDDWAPYAFVDLRQMVVHGIDKQRLLLTLACAPVGGQAGRIAELGNAEAHGPGDVIGGRQVQIVFLLPDGRWQIVELPRLQVQLPDIDQLERWSTGLMAIGPASTPASFAQVLAVKPSEKPAAPRENGERMEFSL